MNLKFSPEVFFPRNQFVKARCAKSLQPCSSLGDDLERGLFCVFLECPFLVFLPFLFLSCGFQNILNTLSYPRLFWILRDSVARASLFPVSFPPMPRSAVTSEHGDLLCPEPGKGGLGAVREWLPVFLSLLCSFLFFSAKPCPYNPALPPPHHWSALPVPALPGSEVLFGRVLWSGEGLTESLRRLDGRVCLGSYRFNH